MRNYPDHITKLTGDQWIDFYDTAGQHVFSVVYSNAQGSLEVRAVESHKVAGVIRDVRLLVAPNVSNSVTIRCADFDK